MCRSFRLVTVELEKGRYVPGMLILTSIGRYSMGDTLDSGVENQTADKSRLVTTEASIERHYSVV